MKRYTAFAVTLVALAVGIGLGLAVAPAGGEGKAPGTVYELRKYYAYPGKAEDIHKRFREHTMKIFEKHGIKNVAYWMPADDSGDGVPALVYLVAHASREQADKNWYAFSTDPEWQAVQKESEANGKLVSNVERMYLKPTDYSPLK